MIEVKKPEASAIKFPVGRKCKDSGKVVIFWGAHTYTAVLHGAEQLNVGFTHFTHDGRSSCMDEDKWEPVDIHIYG